MKQYIPILMIEIENLQDTSRDVILDDESRNLYINEMKDVMTIVNCIKNNVELSDRQLDIIKEVLKREIETL